MKIYFTIFCAVLCLTGSVSAQNTKYDKWRQQSFFRGFNVTNLKIKTQQDFLDMKAAGANLAQIGTFGFQSAYAPYEENSPEIVSIDSLVNFCRYAGVYYTIAVRQGPGRRDVSIEQNDAAARSTIWTSEPEQNLYASMVKQIVERYNNDTLFVGINALMEPNPLFFDLAINADQLASKLANAGIDMRKIYSIMIDSIRSADKNIPVIIQSASYSSPEFFSLVPEVNDPFAVYEFHSYRPSELVKEVKKNTRNYPGSFFSLADFGFRTYNKNFFEVNVFSQVLSFQKKTHAPVFMGEFGLATEQNGGEILLSDVTEVALKNGWHFAYWEYRGAESLWDYEALGGKYWTAVKNSFSLRNTASGVQDDEENIFSFMIGHGAGKIIGKFSLEKNSSITVEIFSSEAKKVAEIYSGKNFSPGQHNFEFDPSKLANGIYFIELSDGERNASKKFSISR